MLGVIITFMMFGAIFKFLMVPICMALFMAPRRTHRGNIIEQITYMVRDAARAIKTNYHQQCHWTYHQHYGQQHTHQNYGRRQHHNQHHHNSHDSNRGVEMSRGEALSVLGLPSGASPEEIKKAYQKLIQLVHPDKGGSAYLTQKLIKAKEVLLR